MNLTSPVGYALKAVALLAYDVVVCLLFFSVWTILNLPLLPWALLAVLGSLILLNGAVLFSEMLGHAFGVPFAVSAVISTLLYNLLTIVFTGLVYLSISPKWYVLLTLLIFAVYLLVMAGLYYSGHARQTETAGQVLEKQTSGNASMLLLSIDSNLQNMKPRLAPEVVGPVQAAMNRLRERIASATPFGRVTRPEIVNIEAHIQSELSQINANIQSVSSPESAAGVIAAINRVYELVVNKEKMIVQ